MSRTSLKNRFVALAGLSLLALVVCSLNSLSFGVQANGQAESFQYQYPFQNPELPVEERINNIVSSMTLDEKTHNLFLSAVDPAPAGGRGAAPDSFKVLVFSK